MTRPPAIAPPAKKAIVPVPWSVPVVPLMRAVRPNSVTATTAVSFQSGPRPFWISSKAPSRPPSNCARRPARAAFVGMGVPALEGQRGNAGTIVRGHEARRALGGLTHASDRIVARTRLRRAVVHALAQRDPVDFNAARERLAQGRITMR